MLLETICRTEGDSMVVELIGAVYFEDSQRLRDDIAERLKEAGSGMVIIDCHRLNYIDGSGLSALITIYKEAQKQQCQMSITGTHGVVSEILQLTGLDQMMTAP